MAVLGSGNVAAQTCRYTAGDNEGNGATFDMPCPEEGGGSGGGDRDEGSAWTGPVAQTLYAVAGLAATGGAGIFAWTRVKRRRETLRELLDEIEATYASSKADPLPGIERLTGLRAQLRARHDHGKLDDSHFFELDRRVGDYIWRLRLIDLEQRLPHLPVALVAEIRHLVADGNLSATDIERIGARAEALGMTESDQRALDQHVRRWLGQTQGAPARKPRRIAVVATR